MSNTIKIRRGVKASLPVPDASTAGELRYATDTGELFIDDGSQNKLIGGDLAAKLEWTTVPATAASTGTAGQIAYDGSFLYVCVVTDTWVRAALTTW